MTRRRLAGLPASSRPARSVGVAATDLDPAFSFPFRFSVTSVTSDAPRRAKTRQVEAAQQTATPLSPRGGVVILVLWKKFGI